MKNLKVFYLFIIVVCSLQTVNAQTTRADRKAAEAAKISRILDNKDYVFKASFVNFVNPVNGTQDHVLTTDYDLKVSKDTIIAYLPYFGRAYLAEYNNSSTDGGIKFTATNFTYKVTQSKKGNTQIFITLTKSNLSDHKAVQSMRLDVSSDGYAYLQVTSLNRDPISFNGTLEEREKPKSY